MKKLSKEIQKLPNKPNCVRIFTDGSCWPNPGGCGGWAFIIQFQDKSPERSGIGSEANTTNNRMELMAAIQALKNLDVPCIVELVTDSQYLGKGISMWMDQWKKSGWRQKNSDLWLEIYQLCNIHEVYVTCILGHKGQKENEICDAMASKAAKNLREKKCLNI
jgi:ribonuclease HI